MTRTEIEKVKKELWNGTYSEEEREKLSNETSCREMINSILCYHGEKGLIDENGKLNRYLYQNGMYYSIGKERVMELIDEQKKDFAMATVLRNVYQDNEGLTYNSIVWADEV